MNAPSSDSSQRPIPPWLGATLIALISLLFSSNHVAARLAFDHGVPVVTAVTIRSTVTALAVLVLLTLSKVSLSLPRPTLVRAGLVGVLIAAQSYCLYASVARLPVALALLTFNTFPIVIAVLSWLTGGERPTRRTLYVMPVILTGLVLALDAVGWIARGPVSNDTMLAGVAYALGASLSFGAAMVLTQAWLGKVDGRLRSMLTMTVVAIIAGSSAVATESFQLPVDREGWIGLSLLTVLYGTAITSLFVVLPRIGAVNNSPLMNLEPIFAMLIAWIVLGQTAAPLQIVGALMVVGSVIFLSSRKQ
jgi:drug/metabolite transporter (DMT)-like permease